MSRSIILAALALAVSLAGASRAEAVTRPLDITSKVRMLDDGGAVMHQRGTFNGAPLGAGTVTLATDVGAGRGATFGFEMFNRRGRVRGTGDVKLSFKGTTIVYEGTAKLTWGSGAFRSYRASSLRVSGSGPLSGETFTVRLTGSLTG